MSALGRAIALRSTNRAIALAQDYAADNMFSEVRITRPQHDVFDRSTAVLSNPGDPLVYEGDARFRTVEGGTTYNLGGEPQYFATTAISIPISAPRPRVNDDVEILDCPDPSVIGRHYRISGVDTGGQLPAVHLCQLIGGEPAPNAT